MISPKNIESANNIEQNSSPMQKFAEHIVESNASIQENQESENPNEIFKSEDTQTLITEFLNDKGC